MTEKTQKVITFLISFLKPSNSNLNPKRNKFSIIPGMLQTKQKSIPKQLKFSKLRECIPQIYLSSKPPHPRLIFQHRQPGGGFEIAPHPAGRVKHVETMEKCCTKIDGTSMDLFHSISKNCANLRYPIGSILVNKEIQLEIHSGSKFPMFSPCLSVFRA